MCQKHALPLDQASVSHTLLLCPQPAHRPQLFYFPETEGFRFRGGGGGVYFAAKDLHVAEVSAAISISLQRAPSSRGGGQVARLSVSLGGASSGAAAR